MKLLSESRAYASATALDPNYGGKGKKVLDLMAHPPVVGIIPARVDSTRLPRKVLREVNGTPLIGYVITRAERILNLERVIVATTERPVDDPLVEYAMLRGVSVFRGDFKDVALRVLECATESGGEYFARLNGDSPFLDPDLIGEGIQHCTGGTVDLVTNLVDHSFPYGIAVEIVRVATFKETCKHMVAAEDREHVTKYLYDHIQEFQVVVMRSSLKHLVRARLVVDTEEDLRVFSAIVDELGERWETSPYQDIAELYLHIQKSMSKYDRG